MIKDALTFITSELNDFLKVRSAIGSEDMVILSNIINQDGGVAIKEDNKIILSLINIEEEINRRSMASYIKTENGNAAHVNPSVQLNLYVMFSAYFTNGNYPDSLKFISDVIAFFQAKRVFTPQNSPRLNDKIDKLIFELIKLSYQELSHLWGMVGAKYLPSAIYKVRMLTIQEGVITDDLPTISGPDSSNTPLSS